MGGETYLSPPPTEDESLLGQDFPHELINSSVSSEDEGLSQRFGNDSPTNGESGLIPRISSIYDAVGRQRLKLYAEVSRTYEDLQPRTDRLDEAKTKILSYKPGSLAEKAVAIDSSVYDVPNTTSLLLIGPKASGKSALVNKISRVLENDLFTSERAQVSCNSSTEDGTYFLHEYAIPRDSGSFCLYDTRSLSVDVSENTEMVNRWMTNGVRHGELIERHSDGTDLKARLKCKARKSSASSKLRAVNFVVFVVNGLSVLESMDSIDEKKKEYSRFIAANFNNPLLSFKDDKPVVVVTHGDLLTLSDRVRIRVYLGELIGVPPTTQIFDIPENNDPATTLAIVDMLIYCLERADRYIPAKLKNRLSSKISYVVIYLLVWIILAMAVIFRNRGPHSHQPLDQTDTSPPIEIEWHKIRHLWSE
ncbi:hypothetical protein ABFX02_04G221000 [Erythranthe guttata]